MTNLQAALGVAQMEELAGVHPPQTAQLRALQGTVPRLCIRYADALPGGNRLQQVVLQPLHRPLPDHGLHAGDHCRPPWQGHRDPAIWGLVNEQKPYEHEETYQLEKAPYYADRILNIPSSTQITEDEIRYVADEVKQLLSALAVG